MIEKPVIFRGSSLDDLRAFPPVARQAVGYQINRLQFGDDPADWKPLNTLGKGVREIRVRAADGAFRVVYVAKFEDAIYVLHCFRKKTQKTGKRDLDLAASRFAELVKELGKK